jgi:hypothetical protein
LALLLSADFGGGLAQHTARKKGFFYLIIPHKGKEIKYQYCRKICIFRCFCGGGGA